MLDYHYAKLMCSKCGRKILVEAFLIGVSHTASTTATCAECIGPLTEDYKREHPEAAADLEAWRPK